MSENLFGAAPAAADVPDFVIGVPKALRRDGVDPLDVAGAAASLRVRGAFRLLRQDRSGSGRPFNLPIPKSGTIPRQKGMKSMRSSAKEIDSWRLEERRKERRYTLILRAGLLEQQGRTSFCLVKNISSTGIQLKVYNRPALGAASLRVADEQPVAGRLIWIKDDSAGIGFYEELDPATLLRVQQKLRPTKRRALPRVRVDARALLRICGSALRATVCDISNLGARIRVNAKLKPGDRATIEFPDLPSIGAYVRWAEDDEAGLAFETPIPMHIIANWIQGRARPVA